MALTAAEKHSTYIGLKRVLDPSVPNHELGTVLDSFITASHLGEVTLDGTETLTNKTFSTPALTTPTLTAPVFASSPTGDGVLQWAEVAITNAQMLALRATPKTLVAAPGAGKVIEFVQALILFDYTGAYTETDDNLAVKYTDGSGAIISEAIEATGFVDATADSLIKVERAASAVLAKTAAENKAIVLHNTGNGEWGGGNAANAVRVKVAYRVWSTGF